MKSAKPPVRCDEFEKGWVERPSEGLNHVNVVKRVSRCMLLVDDRLKGVA